MPELAPFCGALGAAAPISAGAPKEREAEGVTDGVSEDEELPIGVKAGESEAAADFERVGVNDAVAVADMVAVEVGESEIVELGLTVAVLEVVGERLVDGDTGEPEAVTLTVSEGETEIVEVGLTGDMLVVGDGVKLPEVVGESLIDGETGEPKAVPLTVGDGDAVMELVQVGLSVPERLVLGVTTNVPLAVEVVVIDGVPVGVSVGLELEMVGKAEFVDVGVSVGLAAIEGAAPVERELDGVGVIDGVSDEVDIGVRVPITLAVMLAAAPVESEGLGVGVADEETDVVDVVEQVGEAVEDRLWLAPVEGEGVGVSELVTAEVTAELAVIVGLALFEFVKAGEGVWIEVGLMPPAASGTSRVTVKCMPACM